VAKSEICLSVKMMKTSIRFIAIYVLLSGILGGAALVQVFPIRPSSWVGWLSLFVLVIPAALAGELLGKFLFHNRLSEAVRRCTQGRSFSLLRTGYLLILALLVCGTVVVINGCL
jgi:hypothetical protein